MCGGGAEHVIAILSDEMCKRGYDVSILLTSDDIIDYELNENVKVVQISERTGGGLSGRLKRISAIRRYYKAHRDAAYIGMETSTNIFALIAGTGLDMNITVSERIDPGKYSSQGLMKRAYETLGRKFIFQTGAQRDYFCKKIRDRSVIIPNPIDPEVLKLTDAISSTQKDREKVILSVGRLNEQKDYPVLLEAFRQFCLTRDDYELKIYGKGEDEESLKSLTGKLGIADKVRFMGFSRNIWENEYNDRMFVMSSHYEGMPNALIEAMTMGLPCISTDCPIGGPAELIDNDSNGLLVPIKDPKALCKAMLKIANDDDLCNRLSLEAIKIKKRLSLSVICNEWIEKLLG